MKTLIYDFAECPLGERLDCALRDLGLEVTHLHVVSDYSGVLQREHLADVDLLITRVFDHYSPELFSAAKTKFVATTHTDTSHFDVDFLRQNSIALSNVPKYATTAVAELTLAMMLCLARQIPTALEQTRRGNWNFTPLLGTQLHGKTLGIVGFGDIGQKLADFAIALGMQVLYSSRRKSSAALTEQVELDNLFSRSDFISINLPLTQETEQSIGCRELARLKNGACILCPSRSEIFNLAELYEFVASNEVVVWFDELDPKWRNQFAALRHCYLTPDYGWFTKEAQERLEHETLLNVESYLNGECRNRVV